MVVAMKVGMVIYHLKLDTVLVETRFAAMNAEYPIFGHWMMVASMAFAMLVFMRYYHGSTWQFCGEMIAAMLVPPAVLTVPVLHSLVPIEYLEKGSNWLMIPAMAMLMLYRRGHHVDAATGHSAHHDALEARSSGAWQASSQPRPSPSLLSIPRWAKAVGIVGLIAVGLFVVLQFSRGHDHETGAHEASSGATEHGAGHP